MSMFPQHIAVYDITRLPRGAQPELSAPTVHPIITKRHRVVESICYEKDTRLKISLLPGSSQQRPTAISKTRSPPSILRESPVSPPRTVAMRSLPTSASTPWQQNYQPLRLDRPARLRLLHEIIGDIPTPSLCWVQNSLGSRVVTVSTTQDGSARSLLGVKGCDRPICCLGCKPQSSRRGRGSAATLQTYSNKFKFSKLGLTRRRVDNY
jgi:hypothetical protein